ncbi:hypothetical protein [Paractinoplanes atraurantiacus]|uniref:hypothetical protein n=1 Tax=Paractinoplanes atraurantiacus TaxID=1036182 RepID=UPI001FE7DF25|nr:hypothetical protein [Actinoplanes atraurantiacus]
MNSRYATRTLTDQFGRRGAVERFVVDTHHDVARGAHVTAPALSLRVEGGRGVERPGGGSAPVHDQGVRIVVAEADTAHVPHHAVDAVQPAEDEAVPSPRQLLPLPPERVEPTAFRLVQRLGRQLGLQLLRQAFTACCGHVEKRLFLGNGILFGIQAHPQNPLSRPMGIRRQE